MKPKKMSMYLLIICISIVLIYTLLTFLPKAEKSRREIEAENILRNFISTHLKNEYHPSMLYVKRGLLENGEISPSSDLYGILWDKNNEKIYAYTKYNAKDSNIQINFLQVFINQSPTGDYFSSLNIQKHFNHYREIKCVNITLSSKYCESYFTILNNKIFVGSYFNERVPNLIVFVCEIPEGSEIYDWKSCNIMFKDRGV